MDSTRIHAIHADPSSATPAEIQSLAETAYQFHRTRGTKTLRDEFAMAALTGLLQSPRIVAHMEKFEKKASEVAYQIADGMMGARDK